MEEEEKEGKVEEEKKSAKDDLKVEKPKEETESDEEDGEINDGEKPKKAFIPRVLCKYYQRGKCSWGRGCKFLHPGVNDTGNYSFLEFQDPNAKVFQRPEQTVQQTTAPTTDADSSWFLFIAKKAFKVYLEKLFWKNYSKFCEKMRLVLC